MTNMSKHSISIITVNYNNYEGLKKTINSVVSQVSADIQFIVIDGGSDDGSLSLLTTYNDHLYYWISEPDKGIYQAMNKGIKVASGDYILFLNSGDVLHQNDVVIQSLALMKDGLDIYYGDIIYDEIHMRNRRSFPRKLNFAFFYNENISHQASFIKRGLFTTIGSYNEENKIVSDWEFFTYAICKCGATYMHLDLIITDYDATGISSNLNNHAQMNLERQESLERYFPEFIDDYKYLSHLRNKKTEQFLYIKSHPLAYKILKACINIILFFLPKFKDHYKL